MAARRAPLLSKPEIRQGLYGRSPCEAGDSGFPSTLTMAESTGCQTGHQPGYRSACQKDSANCLVNARTSAEICGCSIGFGRYCLGTKPIHAASKARGVIAPPTGRIDPRTRCRRCLHNHLAAGGVHRYVGLDVHKAAVCVAVAEGGRGGEIRQLGVFDNRPELLRKLATRLSKAGHRLSFCYESRPLQLWAASVVDRSWT